MPSRLMTPATHEIRPDDLKEEAIASPPPIIIAIPQGISFASFHSRSFILLPSSSFRPLGNKKRKKDAKKATVESLTKDSTPSKLDHQFLKIKPIA